MIVLQLAVGGLPLTAVLVMLGEGVVVIHRGTGVTNFAAASVGVVGAYVFYYLWPAHGLPWPLALVAALIAAGAIGAACHVIIMRRLRRASIATKVISTLGVMTLLQALADQYFAPGGAIRAVTSFLPAGHIYTVGKISIGSQTIELVVAAVAVTAVLVAVERATRFGLATTAVCENQTVAAGMGWSPDVIATANWALGSAVSALAIILLCPISGLAPDSLTLLIVPALGAALIGRFDSVLLTVVGAVAIGIGEAEVGTVTSAPGWDEAAPLIIVVAILAIRPSSRLVRNEVAPRLAIVGNGRIGIPAVLGTAAALLAIVTLSLPWLSAMTTSMIVAMTLLSIVVLTGYAGQLSLAQFGLAGVSAFLTALFAARFGLSLWIAMVLAIILAIPVGLVVAVPALRNRGATLAIATLSLLIAIEDLILTNPTAIGWLGTASMPTLQLFGLSLTPVDDPRAYAVFTLVVLGLTATIVANLRRSPYGRRLLAIRSNPQAAASLGISPLKTCVYAFTLSTAIAATCGAMLEAQLAYPSFTTFSTQGSITTVLQSMVGGTGFVGGAMLGSGGAAGGIVAWVLSQFIDPSNWLTIFTSAAFLAVILQSPDGVVPLLLRQLEAVRTVPRRLARKPRTKTIPARAEDPFLRAIRREAVRPGKRVPASLAVERLTVSFGGVHALRDVSLRVHPGEIVGLIGPNGAGKSTFIDAVCGLQRPETGSVCLGGSNLDRLSVAQRAQRGLARSFQSLELFEDMSVGENLLAASEHPGAFRALGDLLWPRSARTTEAAVAAADDFHLNKLIDQTPRTLDHGKRRLAAIARTFATDPGVLLLDEPAAGLDGAERLALSNTLRHVATQWNLGVLLVEHDIDFVFRICDRVVALVAGQVVAEGLPEEVRSNRVVTEAYLGSATGSGCEMQFAPVDDPFGPTLVSDAEDRDGDN
jgi:ABC-type branched-subunit amino acid transport system ATPase component/ABC-type branched-subunit amino acid transport system permease subunit